MNAEMAASHPQEVHLPGMRFYRSFSSDPSSLRLRLGNRI
jgi:hypothetical protein